MKINAVIKATSKRAKDIFELCPSASNYEMTIPIDEDYIDDFDDVIKNVEAELSEITSVSLYCDGDFEITNSTDICEDLFNRDNY